MNNTIIIIDDDQVDQLSFKRVFKELNIVEKLVFCSDGISALKKIQDLKTKDTCLVLLDINMPGINGLQVLSRLKKENSSCPAIPVIIVTTSEEKNDVETARNLGAFGYVTKSINYNEFKEKIEKIYRYWKTNEFPFLKLGH